MLSLCPEKGDDDEDDDDDDSDEAGNCYLFAIVRHVYCHVSVVIWMLVTCDSISARIFLEPLVIVLERLIAFGIPAIYFLAVSKP